MPDDLESLLQIATQTGSQDPTAPPLTKQDLPSSASALQSKIQAKAKRFSWTLFALILICFFLPFFQVSCQGQRIISISGIQLAFGTEIQQPTMFGPTQTQHVPGDALMLFIMLIAAVGLALSLVKGKLGHLLPGNAAGLGFLLMLVSKMRIDNDVLRQGAGMLTVDYAFGFIAVSLLFLSGAAGHLYFYFLLRKSTHSTERPLGGGNLALVIISLFAAALSGGLLFLNTLSTTETVAKQSQVVPTAESRNGATSAEETPSIISETSTVHGNSFITGLWRGRSQTKDQGETRLAQMSINFNDKTATDGECRNQGRLLSISADSILIEWPDCGREKARYSILNNTLSAQGETVDIHGNINRPLGIQRRWELTQQ